jgi:RimJ/RimL family protein N-acetyltransferase
MPNQPLQFQTARLDVVATTLAHLDAELSATAEGVAHPLAALLGAVVSASWPPGMYDTDAMQFFRDQLSEHGESSIGWFGWYAIARADHHLVASGGYFGPPAAGVVEIGYSVVPERRGQGIATELIEALASRALALADVDCVIAHTDEANAPSQAALRRAGFVLVSAGSTPDALRFERHARDASRPGSSPA